MRSTSFVADSKVRASILPVSHLKPFYAIYTPKGFLTWNDETRETVTTKVLEDAALFDYPSAVALRDLLRNACIVSARGALMPLPGSEV